MVAFASVRPSGGTHKLTQNLLSGFWAKLEFFWESLTKIRRRVAIFVNLLTPAGHVMHQQFNIQQLYVLPTLYLRVLHLSENKERLVPLTA